MLGKNEIAWTSNRSSEMQEYGRISKAEGKWF